MTTPDIFEQFGFARYTPAGGRTFHLRATMVGDVFERRVIERKRPGLEAAAPCDDTGPNNDAFDATFFFARTDTGLAALVGEPIYPDYFARFMRESRVEGTATYYYPGRGEKRVRLRRRSSRQIPTERDCEAVDVSLLEDGEDNRAGSDTFALPSAKSAGPVLVRQFIAEAAPIGLGGDLLSDLEDAMNALEAAANAPFVAAADIGRQADRVLNLCARIRRLHTAPAVPFDPPAFAPLSPPEAVAALVTLAQIESAAAAQRPAIFGTGTVRARRFNTPLSIFEIAALLGQPIDDLIRMNARLPLFGIPAGTQVLVKAA